MAQSKVKKAREFEMHNLETLNHYSALHYINPDITIDECLFCGNSLNKDLTHTQINDCIMFSEHEDIMNEMNHRIDFFMTGGFLKNKMASFLDLNAIKHQVYSKLKLPKQYYPFVDIVQLDDVYLEKIDTQDNFLILHCKTQKKQDIKIIFGYQDEEKLPASIIHDSFFYYFKVDIYNEYTDLEDIIVKNRLLLMGEKINDFILQKFDTQYKRSLHFKAIKKALVENEKEIKSKQKRKANVAKT